ncbi:MAG: helix-turn-helix domain-containing protein [Verrucomicrobiota bacterium]
MNNRRSMCPVACTLDLIGDKWTLLVVRDLLLGRSLFKEFRAAPERIATNILSDRLTKLINADLVETYDSPAKAGTDAYRLTEKGRSLGKIVEDFAQWGLDNIEGTEIRLKPKT